MAKPIANSKTNVELSMKHLRSLEDAELAFNFADDQESKAEIWARGHALSARNNWADFGTLSTIKLRKNEAGNTFCDITNAEGKTSSMKLLSEVEWDLFYELQVTLQEYKEAKAEMNILISAHGKWSTKDYFNLVQVVV
jgi:hypothetical protein